MSSSAMLRPGIAVGQYPQREDIRESWLEKKSAALIGSLRAMKQSKSTHYSSFVKRVNVHAETLQTISDEDLKIRATTVRRKLYGEGMLENNVVEAFSLIRELSSRILGMRHYDVQLFGGRVMLNGKIAEMETGEGKTLTATLPAATAALSGIPVHVITVNDFLVTRDANWMRPLYQALGLTVGTITEGMSAEHRRQAYACDITYCTNKELVFDYLKDRLVLGSEDRALHLQLEGLYRDKPRTSQLLLRGLCFAIVDEADSALIDEARTPLIISKTGESRQEQTVYKQAIQIARDLERPRDFEVRKRDRQIELTDFGKARLSRFAGKLGGIWAANKRREELAVQALTALHLYEANKHYLLQNGKINIIDEYTGRVMKDRSWERGLHQMIEAKEGFELSGRQETLARISYQKFYRRYLRLAGMTGTAREVSKELWSVYRLAVTRLPTNKPLRRESVADIVYATAEQKWTAVVNQVGVLHDQGRPVLLGTRSVAASEHVSKCLTRSRLQHQVLNARQDQEEAKICGRAGERGQITVATNMAGRGTDIRLSPGVAELGGLHVLATERHDAHRIDRQLFGRAARQGDPGSYAVLLSLEDELLVNFWGDRLNVLKRYYQKRNKPLPGWIGWLVTTLAQNSAERHHSRARQDLLKLDDNLSDMLAFSGRSE